MSIWTGRTGWLGKTDSLQSGPVTLYTLAMDYAMLHMDTYKVVQLLQSKGYTQDEAEGFIAAIQEITLSGVATKQDIADLKTEIADMKHDMLKFHVIHSIAVIGVMVALFQVF